MARALAIILVASTMGCGSAERRCGFTFGCENQTRYRPITDDVSARVLATAACKWKGDYLIRSARTCEHARSQLEELVRVDPDCAQYQDAGPVLLCP